MSSGMWHVGSTRQVEATGKKKEEEKEKRQVFPCISLETCSTCFLTAIEGGAFCAGWLLLLCKLIDVHAHTHVQARQTFFFENPRRAVMTQTNIE